MAVQRTRLATASRTLEMPAAATRPWSTGQLFVIPVLFGTLAGGMLAAINYRRMGRAESSSMCVFAGVVLSVVLAVLVCAIPENALRPIGLLFGLAVGVGFAYAQKPELKKWMERHVPEEQRERYYGGGLGVMFGVGLLCLAIQVGITYLLYLQMHG